MRKDLSHETVSKTATFFANLITVLGVERAHSRLPVPVKGLNTAVRRITNSVAPPPLFPRDTTQFPR